VFKCPPLRLAIESLIEQGYLKFAPADAPNTVNSPLLNHEEPAVNMLSRDQSTEVSSCEDRPYSKQELLQTLLLCNLVSLLPAVESPDFGN
jgi:hypothetical protein